MVPGTGISCCAEISKKKEEEEENKGKLQRNRGNIFSNTFLFLAHKSKFLSWHFFYHTWETGEQ